MDSKLNLDLEELRAKYDNLFPEIFRSLDHVKDPRVRGQFECLLTDVYDTFLIPELLDSTGQRRLQSVPPSQFLRLIQKFLQDQYQTTNRKDVFDAIKHRRINLAAVTKLERANAIKTQVDALNDYFEDILNSLPKPVDDENSAAKCTSPRRRLRSGKSCTSPKKTSWTAHDQSNVSSNAIPTFNEAHNTSLHCKANPEDGLSSEPKKIAERPLDRPAMSRVLLTEGIVQSAGSAASPAPSSLNGVTTAVDYLMFDTWKETSPSTTKQKFIGPRNYAVDNSAPQKNNSSKQAFVRAIIKAKSAIGEMRDFQLNLPPRYLRNSVSLTETSKAGTMDQDNPCRKKLGCSDGSITIELPANGLMNDTCSQDISQAGNYPNEKTQPLDSSGNSTGKFSKQGKGGRRRHVARRAKWQNDPTRASTSTESGGYSLQGCVSSQRVDRLVESVQAMGMTLQDRRLRIDALRNSNALLTKQITDVQSTIASFNTYVCSDTQPAEPATSEAVSQEMVAFHEHVLKSIISCIDYLSSYMIAQRKTEQTKATKVRSLLTQYETAKQGSYSEEVSKNSSGKGCIPPLTSDKSSAKYTVSNDELRKRLNGILSGVESFHDSCEGIWDDTMARVAAELETLLASRPVPAATRWSPDDPGASLSAWFSPSWSLEKDIRRLKVLPDDITKYGEVVLMALQTMDRISSEMCDLMNVTRVRDLQIISINHNIGLSYIYNRQTVITSKLAVPPTKQSISAHKAPSKPRELKAKSSAPNATARNNLTTSSNQSQTLCGEQPEKLRPPELVPHERKLQQRHSTDSNVDQRLLRQCPSGGREKQDDYSAARDANRGVLSHQMQTNNAQHMGASADMKLPLMYLPDSSQELDVSALGLSSSSGFSPWDRQNCAPTCGVRSRKHKHWELNRGESNSAKSRGTFPKIHKAAKPKPKSQPRETSRGPATDSAEKPNNMIIRGTVMVSHDKRDPETFRSCRPVQYCHALSMPRPPSNCKRKKNVKLPKYVKTTIDRQHS